MSPNIGARRTIRRPWDRLPPEFGSLNPRGPQPKKEDCPGCVAAKAADWADRWPVGDCGPTCLRRAWRLGKR